MNILKFHVLYFESLNKSKVKITKLVLHCFKGIKKKTSKHILSKAKTTYFKAHLCIGQLKRKEKSMHKLQTNKGARYMMIVLLFCFLLCFYVFYIQAVGVVQNVDVKELANEQHNKMVF